LLYLRIRRKRYYFNTSTLSFVEVSRSKRTKLLRGLLTFVAINLVAVVFLLLLYSFFDSPEVTIQKLRAKKYYTRYAYLTHKVDSLTSSLHSSHYTNDQIYRNILEMDSLPFSIRSAGTGGHDPYASPMKSLSDQFFSNLMKKIENLKMQINIQDESYEEIMIAALEKTNELRHIPGIPPVNCTDHVWISSYFGTRKDPFSFIHRVHHGVDFCGPKNTEIFATADGIVTLVEHSRKGYGNEIVVDHGFGHCTRYAHLNSIMIQEGQIVKRGQLIGLMGNTGRSTGTHLHYEVWYLNQPVNPLYFFADDLTPEEFEQLAKNTK